MIAEEADVDVAGRISATLDSPATRNWVKTTLQLALLREPGEAASDGQILAKVLAEWCDGVLAASITRCERTVSSIEEILARHEHSEWLRTALKLAIHRDPIDAAGDAEMLSELLVQQAVAMGHADALHCAVQHGQLPLSLRPEAG